MLNFCCNRFQHLQEDQLRRGLILVRIYSGDLDGVEADLKAFESKFWKADVNWDNQSVAFGLAELYTLNGDFETGFRWLGILEEYSARHHFASVLNSPFLQNLQGDPRWQEFEERTGVAAHQLAEIEFNPRLPGMGSE